MKNKYVKYAILTAILIIAFVLKVLKAEANTTAAKKSLSVLSESSLSVF